MGLKKGDGKTSDFGNITSKWGNSKADEKAEKEAIKQSQKELKRAIDSISDWAKSANKDIDDQIEALKIKNNQSPMDPKEFYSQLYTLEQQKAINTEIAIQEKVSATNNALFKDEADRIGALQEYQREAEDAAKATGKLTNSLSEITGTMQTAIAGFNEEGTTWRREVAGVNIEGLNDVATNAISLLSQKFFELTGKQMVVSSGLRDWGGHVSGNKFDVVDDYSSTLLEDNVNGIRDAIIQYAQSIGLDVLDEYTNPSARATAGHLDFDATNFTGQINQYMTWRAGDMLTKGGEEYRKAIQALFDEGNKLLIQAAKTIDNGNFLEKVEISNKYDELAKKFKAANMNHVVDAIEKIRSTELLNIDFAQTQKDLEYANTDLVNYQEELLNDITDGSKTSGEATQSLIDKHHELFDKYLSQLKEQLDIAITSGNREKVYQIRAEMKTVVDKITDGIQAILKRIDDNLDDEITRLNANLDLTNMQRDDAIEAARRKAAADKVVTLNKQLNELQEKSSKMSDEDKLQYQKDHNGLDIDHEILIIEKQIELNQELSKTPSLLDNIHRSSKQAFEDGLLDFLERGILECENLGDAFRNLAITILQAIQKVYSEALTKNIMQALGLGNSKTPVRPSIGGDVVQGPLRVDDTFAEGGRVEGPGTETSDSILARLSRGEFVINAAAVRKIGLHNLERINTGDIYNLRIPMPKFATGGYVGKVAANAAMQGLTSFSQELGTNISPTFNNTANVRIDGGQVANVFRDIIKADVKSHVEKEMVQNSKRNSMIMKKMW